MIADGLHCGGDCVGAGSHVDAANLKGRKKLPTDFGFVVGVLCRPIVERDRGNLNGEFVLESQTSGY